MSQSSDSRCDGQADRAVVGELGGVGEQVEQRLADLGLVGVHRADVVGARDDQRVAVLLHQRLDDRLDVPHELADLERLQEQVHPPGLDLGEVQDVVDQPQQVLAGRVDPLEVREEGVSSPRSSASSWSISE